MAIMAMKAVVSRRRLRGRLDGWQKASIMEALQRTEQLDHFRLSELILYFICFVRHYQVVDKRGKCISYRSTLSFLNVIYGSSSALADNLIIFDLFSCKHQLLNIHSIGCINTLFSRCYSNPNIPAMRLYINTFINTFNLCAEMLEPNPVERFLCNRWKISSKPRQRGVIQTSNDKNTKIPNWILAR